MEAQNNTNPLLGDTDGDGLLDGDETLGTTSANYFFNAITYNSVPIITNPLLADTDGDGLTDADEISGISATPAIPTNPLLNDTDGDGLSNHQEVIIFNTNPNQAETNSPVAGLYLASQYQANRAGGRNEVLASPNSYGLFNSNQMLDLKFGGMVIGKSNNQLVLTYQINQSTNLTTWTAYREESLVLSNALADKMFLRLAPK